ncbi:MAG TPA: aminotransferase class V-fold PLP-dependent enzyme, partial [Polyangiales bacterium]|nr:aminotransferase class V-fold PLP-dependent enzyme [Polyangiales bacterium]
MSTLQPPRKILLNPGPATTSDRVKHAQIVSDICPREHEFGAVVSAVRAKLGRVPAGGSDYSAVLLGGSGTAAMESCLSSVIPADGHVLIAANGAYGERAIKIAQAYGIAHTALRQSWLAPIDLDAVVAALAAEPRTTHLFFVHHETTTGLLNPFEQLAGLCRERGVATIVDAVSSYAGMALDLNRAPVDYLFSSSNKCVQGFAGLGFVLARRSSLAATERHPRRGVYLNLFDNWQAQEADGQFLFTPPVQVVYALDAALDELVRQRIASSDGQVFALAHAGWLAPLTAGLDAEERARLHRTLAALCDQRGRHALLAVRHLFDAGQVSAALDRLSAYLSAVGDDINRMALSLPMSFEAAAELLQRASEASVAAGRPPRELYDIRAWVMMASATTHDSLYWSSAPALRARIELDSGLDHLRTLDPALPMVQRMQIAFGHAFERYNATPESERVYRPDEAIK